MKVKYTIIAVIFAVIISNSVSAQDNVGIGTNTPHPSAKLHIEANDKGVLIPRLTSAQRLSIVAPATGLLV